MKFACPIGLCVVALSVWPIRVAHAQGFLSLTAGIELPAHDSFVQERTSGSAINPTTRTATYHIKNGLTPDVSGGYIFPGGIGVMAGLNYFRGGDFAQARISTSLLLGGAGQTSTSAHGSSTELRHNESAMHLDAVYRLPFGGPVEARVFAGVSRVKVKQDVVDVFFTDQTFNPITITLNRVDAAPTSASGRGWNAGADVAVFVGHDRIAALVGSVRVVRATLDLVNALNSNSTDNTVGPFEAGGTVVTGGVLFTIK